MQTDRPPRTDSARRSLLQYACLGLLRLFGWRALTAPLPGPRGVIMVYPHTSNRDFIFGLLYRFGTGLRANWIGKDTIFRWPFRGLMMRIGGVPCGLGFIDHATKTLGIQEFVRFSGSVEDDLSMLRAFYAAKRGHHPDGASEIRFEEKGEGAN